MSNKPKLNNSIADHLNSSGVDEHSSVSKNTAVKMLKGISKNKRKLTSDRRLGSQLTLLVAIGMFIMVISVSIGTSIIINQSLTNNFIQNGKNIAGVLAEQAALPVLVGSPEGARQAIDVVSSFPSISQMAIYELDGNLLAQSGEAVSWHMDEGQKPYKAGEALLEHDGDNYWQFLSVVQSDNAEPELENLEANHKQDIGIVRVLVSKGQLYSARNNIILGNVIVLLSVASLLVLALNGLSGALTKPLEDFVATMASGARGERSNLRVDLSGSKETQQLSNAFNQMMQVLEDRELQLATARDHALAAAKLKSEFAANVSHEIRTPLNGILGTLNLLGDTGLNADQQDLITLAESSSEALMILINDILDFSRLSLDQSTLSNTEFDLYQLLEELMFLHAQSADAERLDVLTYYDSDLPFVVESDPNKLRQLMNNLINNAVKFTDSGSIMISAKKETDAEGKLWIRLSVCDTGIGISEKDLHTIFLPYSQSDGSMSRKYSGTGLGLAICDKLAELLHGDIGVHSDLGSGSEFYVRIPFSYRVKSAVRSGLGSVYALQDQALLAYGSSEEIRDACQSICGLHQIEANLFDNISELGQYLSADQSDTKPAPIVMLYLSFDDSFDAIWQQVGPAIQAAELKVIIISRDAKTQLKVSDNIVFTRPPLRANAFSSALASLLNLELPKLEGASKTQSYGDMVGYSILLVEDTIVNQRVAKAMLEKLGCDVVVVETGVEALEQVEQRDFDLIYMDCQMPRMNGYDASRAIRQIEGKKGRLPIVAMTANVGQQDRAHCFEAGMNDFLSKPVKLEDLANITRKWIGATRDDLPGDAPNTGAGNKNAEQSFGLISEKGSEKSFDNKNIDQLHDQQANKQSKSNKLANNGVNDARN